MASESGGSRCCWKTPSVPGYCNRCHASRAHCHLVGTRQRIFLGQDGTEGNFMMSKARSVRTLDWRIAVEVSLPLL